jgi:hypothetical protein
MVTAHQYLLAAGFLYRLRLHGDRSEQIATHVMSHSNSPGAFTDDVDKRAYFREAAQVRYGDITHISRR